jgi:sigma-54 dependent transcriptional regulator, acetoin dehydrogenase operon transcriptional activator AcoR
VSNALRVARSSSTVFLVGETGTGKEVLARAIHRESDRKGRFVGVNCGALVQTLIESELFGFQRGAFSGANEDREGLMRAADGGTLFLDEVAELPEASQVALLRVLQEQEVLPVGGTVAVPIDVRVIAAAQQDLPQRVAEGRFRADLYARLSGYVVDLVPLRNRIEDLGLLIGQLLHGLDKERAGRLRFSSPAAGALFRHAWPFNVRELEQALRSALAITTDDEIRLEDLPAAILAGRRAAPAPAAPQPEAQGERERILDALEACAGNQTRAARVLGISRATLVNKLSIHRVPRPRKRDQ